MNPVPLISYLLLLYNHASRTYSFNAKVLLNVSKSSERLGAASLARKAPDWKGAKQGEGIESENVPENVLKIVLKETHTLLDTEVAKPVHFILYTLLKLKDSL